MATAVIMPRQGQSVESCVITKWHKAVGDRVSVGDVLFSYETDKAAFDEEAKAEGVVLAIFFGEGDDVACLTNVCVIGEPSDDFSGFNPREKRDVSVLGFSDEQLPVTEIPAAAASSIPVFDLRPAFLPIDTQPEDDSGRKKISPRARALVERSGTIIERIVPTGPGGRILERDVEALIIEGRHATFTPASTRKESAETDEFEIVALSGVRKTIAKSMHASLVNSAQLTINTSFDASDVLEFRKKAKAAGSLNLPAASVTDIIVFAVSRTLAAHKNLNAHFLEDNRMKIFKEAHIGVAVDTPRGLLVPTIFGASCMTLLEISAEARRLYSMCAQGSINPDLLRGASFTISNLGVLGIENFTPILNTPQTGILGVCAVTERWRNGKTYPAMGLSLTFDHRALDGADAARFLKDLTVRLENFSAYALLEG